MFRPSSSCADRLRFQFISDLHLEFYENETELKQVIQDVADSACASYLFIPGDLGYPFEKHYEQALEKWSQTWKHIVLNIGNHECYNHKTDSTTSKTIHTIDQVVEQVRKITSKFQNITF